MKLLEPVKLGELELPNRVIMAPMTRCRASYPGGIPSELSIEYYRQRSSAGLIISEGVAVSTRARGTAGIPGLYSDEQIPAWRRVTGAVHQAGGRIFAQLWHAGSVSHPDFHNGSLPHSASDVDPKLPVRTPGGRKLSVAPKPMSTGEIEQTVQDFRNAAVRALESGFDGIEIHSSNGYLFHQFFSRTTNLRTDRYGGSRENRTRFYFEVLDALTSAIPSTQVASRLNPLYHGRVGILLDEESLPTFEYIVRRANEYQLAYLHISRPFFPVESPFLIDDVPGHFRKLYEGHLMVNGGYGKEDAEAGIEAGKADSVAFGTPFIGNPDLVERFRHNYSLAESDRSTYYSNGPEGYTDYPVYGKS